MNLLVKYEESHVINIGRGVRFFMEHYLESSTHTTVRCHDNPYRHWSRQWLKAVGRPVSDNGGNDMVGRTVGSRQIMNNRRQCRQWTSTQHVV